jgi:hypothetical protein
MPQQLCENLNQIYQDCVNLSPVNTPGEVKEKIGYRLDLYWRENRAKGNGLSDIDDAFSSGQIRALRDLNTRGSVILNKQQPSLVEAIDETTKRLKFMEKLVENQPNSISGVIMGGSLSYGRFVNVRSGYPCSSDLDLIVVTNSVPSNCDIQRMLPVNIGFTEGDQVLLRERFDIFRELKRLKLADMMSHKFTMPQNGFDASIHFMSQGVFSRLCHPQETGTEPSSLLDYKAGPFPHQIMRQKDMLGDEVQFKISEQGVRLGVITNLPVYRLDEVFVPGIYHNLLSPMFETFYGDQTVRQNIEDFGLLLGRFARKVNSSLPDITLSHPRKPLFSPYIIKEVNEKI